jgi:DNA-binding transcriptional ArsR family regulator
MTAPRPTSTRRAPMTAPTLDAAIAALGDATRRKVIGVLLRRPHRAGELARALAISPPALSRHLRQLRRSGLIVDSGVERDARVRVYTLNPGALAPLRSWLDQVEGLWRDQLQAFKAHAERSHDRRGRRR